MPLQTPSSKPDPNDPYDPVEPDRPFTSNELLTARFVNAAAVAGAAFLGLLSGFAVARQEAAAERLIQGQRDRARFDRARQWAREHPDAS